MRRAVVIAALLIAGCSEVSPEEQAERDARDVALVERANDVLPPLDQVTPEPILVPDVERLDLDGVGCHYAPGTSLNTRVVARENDAFMKIEGVMTRFAADPGARELPAGTRSLYNGRAFTLRLRIDGEGTPAEDGTVEYEGSIALFDPHGRVAYEGTGLVECSG